MAFWQFNEPWPAVSWSLVDRRGRPKAAYSMLMRSYQPLLVAAVFERRAWRAGDRFDAEIWVVNDGAEEAAEGEVEALLDGRSVCPRSRVAAPPASARQVGAFGVQLAGPPATLALAWRAGGAVLAANEYDLQVYLPPPQP